MSPPIHVKVIACVVNTFVLIAGVRNIAAPGVVVPVIPEDAAFQAHFHPEPGYFSADDPRMAFVFQLLGVGALPRHDDLGSRRAPRRPTQRPRRRRDPSLFVADDPRRRGRFRARRAGAARPGRARGRSTQRPRNGRDAAATRP